MTVNQGEAFTNLVDFLPSSSPQSPIPTQPTWNILDGKKFLELAKDFTEKKLLLAMFWNK